MDKMWGILLHLSYNMWSDNEIKYPLGEYCYCGKMLFDKKIWDEVTEFCAASGLNTVVIDLGDAVKYQSHPEIALPDAWTVEELRRELDRLRDLGLTPIPKLNFSTGHDAWMGIYSRMVSTPPYYQVCRDLIEEVIDLFEKPAYFHLGLDEENEFRQMAYSTVNFRTGRLLWHDLNLLFDTVRSKDVKPWIWADYFWMKHEEFLQEVAKDVVLSGWFYSRLEEDPYGVLVFDEETRRVRDSFIGMDKAGYRQIPTGSNWATVNNMEDLVRYCKENLDQDRVDGYLMAPWEPTIRRRKYALLEGADVMGLARHAYEK